MARRCAVTVLMVLTLPGLAHSEPATAQIDLAYEERCAICHDSLDQLARHSLVIIDGTMCGRYSRIDIEKFLLGHARLDATEAAHFAEQLRRASRSVESDRAAPAGACPEAP
ncbi:MAG: hypothetical protein ACR2PM_07080 [Hyphomicrobiales bacterium]